MLFQFMALSCVQRIVKVINELRLFCNDPDHYSGDDLLLQQYIVILVTGKKKPEEVYVLFT